MKVIQTYNYNDFGINGFKQSKIWSSSVLPRRKVAEDCKCTIIGFYDAAPRRPQFQAAGWWAAADCAADIKWVTGPFGPFYRVLITFIQRLCRGQRVYVGQPIVLLPFTDGGALSSGNMKKRQLYLCSPTWAFDFLENPIESYFSQGLLKLRYQKPNMKSDCLFWKIALRPSARVLCARLQMLFFQKANVLRICSVRGHKEDRFITHYL